MKKLGFIVVMLMIAAPVSFGKKADKTYTGEIMDSQCAALGGHMIMMQKDESAKDCTLRCVKIGGKFTLFDAATKTAYQLDDQKKAEQFAGAKVKVTGTLNSATKTIKVTDIKAAS